MLKTMIERKLIVTFFYNTLLFASTYFRKQWLVCCDSVSSADPGKHKNEIFRLFVVTVEFSICLRIKTMPNSQVIQKRMKNRYQICLITSISTLHSFFAMLLTPFNFGRLRGYLHLSVGILSDFNIFHWYFISNNDEN